MRGKALGSEKLNPSYRLQVDRQRGRDNTLHTISGRAVMAKKPRKTSDKKSTVINVSLSASDRATLENFVEREGTSQSGVIKEALDALRVKRAYEAKRSIERPALSHRPKPLKEALERRVREAVPVYDRLREYVPNQLSERPRVTTNVDASLMKELEALAERSGQTKADLLRSFIQKGVDPLLPRDRRDVVSRKTQVIFFSNLLITALEEAIVFDPKRHHNAPPPPLRLEDEDYLREIRALIDELKRLNSNLEDAAKATKKPNAKRLPGPRKAAEKSAVQVKQHINTFLNKYASVLGTGAAALTIGTAGALLHQLGAPFDAIAKVFHR
jgi:predicted DNA-binding protein